ncbi:hypothetical protein FORC20_3401 [Salmonella enterica subsp. enterica serovar Typhimurium]|nr:hypothetical protein FORC20_3401 [Salmonella enterica subsp. enterica serovar Typhimurium]
MTLHFIFQAASLLATECFAQSPRRRNLNDLRIETSRASHFLNAAHKSLL